MMHWRERSNHLGFGSRSAGPARCSAGCRPAVRLVCDAVAALVKSFLVALTYATAIRAESVTSFGELSQAVSMTTFDNTPPIEIAVQRIFFPNELLIHSEASFSITGRNLAAPAKPSLSSSGNTDLTSSRFFFLDVNSSLSLDWLRLTGGRPDKGMEAGAGGAIFVGFGSSLALQSCELVRNHAQQGGAIFADNSLMVIANDCTMTANTATGSGGVLGAAYSEQLAFHACTLTSNVATNSGGVAALYAAKLNLSSSACVQNRAYSGGAVDAAAGSMISLKNSSLIANTAAVTGGAIRSGTDPAGLGAIRSGSVVDIAQSAIRHNKAQFGGGIYSTLGGGIRAVGSTFSSNSAVQLGGAMRASNADVVVNDCILKQNTAHRGGAIDGTEGATLNVRRSLLRDNDAAEGGALFISLGASAYVNDSILMNNVARLNGGAVHVEGHASAYDPTKLVASNCTMIGNTANSGGAIHVSGVVSGVVHLQTCVLKSNSAESGGAIQAMRQALVEAFDTTLQSNSAAKGGGGVCVRSASAVHATRCTFDSNMAHHGRAVENSDDGSEFRAMSCLFESSTSSPQVNCAVAACYEDSFNA